MPTKAELETIVSNGNICRTDRCYYRCARGYIECERCLHGSPQIASPELVKAKKDLERREAQANVS